MLSVAAVDRHRVLLPSFRLKSKAFMLTYNGPYITATSFDALKSFVVHLKTRFGARAWEACLEKSLHAEQATKHHLPAYLVWTDGAGVDIRDLDRFEFTGTHPRIDTCTTKMSTTSPTSVRQPANESCHRCWTSVLLTIAPSAPHLHCERPWR